MIDLKDLENRIYNIINNSISLQKTNNKKYPLKKHLSEKRLRLGINEMFKELKLLNEKSKSRGL